MGADLVRNSLRLALATFVTAAIALWFERLMFLWYPLIAVVVTLDDSDDQTLHAAVARMLGTILGGMVTFVVHTVVDGWIGVLVSLLLMLPLLRLLGWQEAIGTATLISLMFLMVPRYSALDWEYVFNRGLDTAVGCLIAILVGLLFWPHNPMERLELEEQALKTRLREQLGRYRGWLGDAAVRPVPLKPAPFTASLQQLELLMEVEQRGGARRARLLRSRWPERLTLWRGVRHHWLALERLLAALPVRLPAAGRGPESPLWQLITSLEPALASPGAWAPAPASPGAATPSMPSPQAVAGREMRPGPEAEPLSWLDGEHRPALALDALSQDLLTLARAADMPPLLLLAIASEQAAVAKALTQLRGMRRC